MSELEPTYYNESELPESSWYDWLREEEDQPASPDDDLIVTVNGNTAKELEALGVPYSSESLESRGRMVNPFLRTVKRGDLLSAGIAFINRVSRDNQKPLITQFTLPSGEIIDFSERTFLSNEELDLVYQSLHVPEIDYEALRAYACDFMVRAAEIHNAQKQIQIEVIKQVVSEIRTKLNEFMKWYVRTKMKNPGMIFLLANVKSPKFHGIEFEGFGLRHDALSGNPSPFVDCGLRFDGNPDFLIHFPDGRERRLNIMVPHLWMRGIDESGGDDDKIYITAEEFQEFINISNMNPGHFTDEDKQKIKKYLLNDMKKKLAEFKKQSDSQGSE